MNEDPGYRSSIPTHAREEDITERHGAGRGRTVKNYYLGRTFIGKRVYKDGRLEHEYALKNGKRHGWEYRWFGNGKLQSAVPFDTGREHGEARCYAPSGALRGTYTMDHGTGIDLWWNDSDGGPQLTEARVVVDGLMDGYEYWFTRGSPGVLRKEKWWSKGVLHGIEREWSERGTLRRGFPKYWIRGLQVGKREYDRAAKEDVTLRPYSVEDNRPHREYPPEVSAHLP